MRYTNALFNKVLLLLLTAFQYFDTGIVISFLDNLQDIAAATCIKNTSSLLKVGKQQINFVVSWSGDSMRIPTAVVSTIAFFYDYSVEKFKTNSVGHTCRYYQGVPMQLERKWYKR